MNKKPKVLIPSCSCGLPTLLNTIHQEDAPCFKWKGIKSHQCNHSWCHLAIGVMGLLAVGLCAFVITDHAYWAQKFEEIPVFTAQVIINERAIKDLDRILTACQSDWRSQQAEIKHLRNKLRRLQP